MDAKITALIADGANLAVYRPHLDGPFVAYVHRKLINYRGEGATVEAALERLADDIATLCDERGDVQLCPPIGEQVALFDALLVASGESQDVAAWLTDIGEYPIRDGDEMTPGLDAFNDHCR